MQNPPPPPPPSYGQPPPPPPSGGGPPMMPPPGGGYAMATPGNLASPGMRIVGGLIELVHRHNFVNPAHIEAFLR